MTGGYRFRSNDLARVLGTWGSGLGDHTTAHVEGSVLELKRGRDWRLVRLSLTSSLVLAAMTTLAVTCTVVVAFDRLPRAHELLLAVLVALLPGALGVLQSRPKEMVVDRATRTLWSRGKKSPLDPPVMVLARDRAGHDHFDVLLSLRHGGTVFRLTGVKANDASRAKAIAVALAAWLDATLAETSSPRSLQALRDTDAAHRLVLAPADPPEPVPPKPRVRIRKGETAVDVAVFAVELLNAL